MHRARLLVASIALAAALAWAVPSGRARLLAAPTTAEALGAAVPRPFAEDVVVAESPVPDVEGRLYTPGPEHPAIVAVPGATPAGLDDPRLARVARAISRNGRQVFVPLLDLYQQRFTTDDIDRIARSVEALHLQTGRPVVMVGFSYGGSFALLAAADPRTRPGLAKVATFGAYFDLIGVLQAVTTGVSLVDGATVEWRGHPLARDILHARAAGLLPPAQADQLLDALAGKRSPEALDSASRAMYDLLTNRDPTLTYQLADRLPDEVKALIDRFSPSSVADRIDVPVFAVHSTDDPAVPYGELLRLRAGLRRAETATVDIFRHVDFQASSVRQWWEVAPDLYVMWRFAAWILEG
ncbi:MAG: hypothetical protein KatS3mg011_1123 [Acidimicrobiia bacterium]|nr:MAG: hypothetical protein KatS3mg011_1123 [Acidimicrobiia bacterium]